MTYSWLIRVNGKKKIPVENQIKEGLVEVAPDLELDGSIKASIAPIKIEEVNIGIIKKL